VPLVKDPCFRALLSGENPDHRPQVSQLLILWEKLNLKLDFNTLIATPGKPVMPGLTWHPFMQAEMHRQEW